MSEQDKDNNRGQGNLMGAMRRRRSSGGPQAPSSGGGEAAGGSPQRSGRKRARVGKRSDARYTLAGAYVREDVYEEVKEALADKSLRPELIEALDEAGVEHQPKKVGYGDLVELLLRQWLEDVGRDVDNG